MRVKELFTFMKERHAIYRRRFEMGYPKPWTDDPILQSYRFCNVYRELDTQTQWFAETWRAPHAMSPDLWFASLVFRFVNWSETATELGYPVPWDPQGFKTILQGRKSRKLKVYSGAYMISTHGVVEEKATYLAKSLTKIWKRRDYLRYEEGMLLSEFHKNLMGCFDVGSFLAAQVVADCKYAGSMVDAPDWSTFAASGPGSRRGMNRIYGVQKNQLWEEKNWKDHLDNLKVQIDIHIANAGMPKIHAQDLQNCLCEFDKYERVRLGEGRPKQKFNGGK